MTSLHAALAAEWIKIRTVRSTVWTLALGFAMSAGLGLLFGAEFRAHFADLPRDQQLAFDPLFATFYSLTFGQLALVTFGALAAGTEYGTGTIGASLAAMPRRGVFYAGKALAVALPVLAVSAGTVLVTFCVAQIGLGPHGTRLDAPAVPQAALGACLYLTLISLFAMGVTAMLRSSAGALAILIPVLLLGSQGLGNVPKLKVVTQYLPDQAGAVIMHLTGSPHDPRFGRDYGPWTGLAILVLWTAAALAGGLIVLRRRDA